MLPPVRHQALLLDTNLLLLLLIGAVDVAFIPKARTLSAFEISDFDLLTDILESFRTLVTTPHILTEASNLLGKEREDIRGFGRQAMAEFVAKCQEQSDPSALLIAEPAYLRLGLTDAAVAVAARLPAFVLTADAPLYAHVSSSGAQAANFNHIRLGAWE